MDIVWGEEFVKGKIGSLGVFSGIMLWFIGKEYIIIMFNVKIFI